MNGRYIYCYRLFSGNFLSVHELELYMDIFRNEMSGVSTSILSKIKGN